MSTKPLTVQLDDDVLSDLQSVAESERMTRTEFAKMVLSRFSRLKAERGLDALTAIPKDFFKARPGRPATRTSGAETKTQQPTLEHAV